MQGVDGVMMRGIVISIDVVFSGDVVVQVVVILHVIRVIMRNLCRSHGRDQAVIDGRGWSIGIIVICRIAVVRAQTGRIVGSGGD